MNSSLDIVITFAICLSVGLGAYMFLLAIASIAVEAYQVAKLRRKNRLFNQASIDRLTRRLAEQAVTRHL